MPVNLTIYGYGPSGDSVYSIQLPMTEEHCIPELITTCRQHAKFQGATRVIVKIDD